MQQPAAYNKAPANRRGDGQKLEAVWMGEAIKHAAGGQLNAQLKKAAVQFVDLYALP